MHRAILLVTVAVLGWFHNFSVAVADEPPWLYPIDIAIGKEGEIFIADLKLPGIWKLKDGALTPVYKGQKKFRTPLNAVRCLAVTPDGTLLAGDSATREVYKVSAQGELTPLSNGYIGIPITMAVQGEELFVSDLELQRIWKLPLAGLEKGKAPTEFAVIGGARGLFLDQDQLWVLTGPAPQLQKFSSDGKPQTIIKDLTFEFPHQIQVKDGTAYVTDGYKKCVWKVTADGKAEPWVQGEPFVNPLGIRFQGDDLLLIDPRAKALFKIPPDGKVQQIFPAK
jgi:WD40 repeat protein